jgi:AraC-like DNA-binding protein
MSSCLDQITDWAELAKSRHYSAAKLASACGVTPRHLGRYFQAHHGEAPHRWLRALRMRLALESIRDQIPLKVVAIELHYKDPAHFAHDFKDYFGVCPSSLQSGKLCRALVSKTLSKFNQTLQLQNKLLATENITCQNATFTSFTTAVPAGAVDRLAPRENRRA